MMEFGIFIKINVVNKGCTSAGGKGAAGGWGKFDEAQLTKIFVVEVEWRVHKNLLPFLSTFFTCLKITKIKSQSAKY